MRHALIALSLVWIVACGSNGGGGDDGVDASTDPLAGLTSLRVEPMDQTLVIAQGVAATSAYTAIGTFEDGRIEDVSAYVVFSLADAGLGSFAAGDFTSTTSRGGRTEVRAAAPGVMGSTGLTLRLEQTWDDPTSTDLPADPAAPFDGPADAGRAPAQVYPNDGVVVPPNLGRLELHFYPGAGNTLFDIPGGILVVFVSVVFVNSPTVFRIVRGLAMDIKTRDYVAAAQTRGEGPWYIMLWEILPNARGPLIVDFCLRVGYTTILLGTLGFFGLGLPPESPDWGSTINEGRKLLSIYLHPALPPALALLSLVLGLNLLADGLREESLRD